MGDLRSQMQAIAPKLQVPIPAPPSQLQSLFQAIKNHPDKDAKWLARSLNWPNEHTQKRLVELRYRRMVTRTRAMVHDNLVFIYRISPEAAANGDEFVLLPRVDSPETKRAGPVKVTRYAAVPVQASEPVLLPAPVPSTHGIDLRNLTVTQLLDLRRDLDNLFAEFKNVR